MPRLPPSSFFLRIELPASRELSWVRYFKMNTSPQAWLENIKRERVPLQGSATIGRAPGNSIVLTGDMISRRHALIHTQGEGEFWLVDLGSRNGTIHNSRRVQLPTMLRPGDKIQFGDFFFIFRLDRPVTPAPSPEDALGETVLQMSVSDIWIAVADIENFTGLSQKLSPDELSQQIGAWLLQCTDWVDRSGGMVDKYLGDGFLAYWQAQSTSLDAVLTALAELNRWQREGKLRFRWILHRATISVRSSPFGGDCLMGDEVIFAFRMEKVAAGLKLPRMISKPAAADLRGRIQIRDVGEHELRNR